jgi:TetR/AcrR family transcriptional regulator, regulator of autoinduction and epiphytic fitness
MWDHRRMSVEPIDGRHLRSARSRAAVVDAMLDLLRERGVQPSAQEIADRAGVSLRTVFRHHDDMDSLLATALAQQVERVGHLFAPVEEMDVDAFVDQRAALFEEIGGVRRAGLRHDQVGVIQQGLADSHRRLRQQVTSAFGVEGTTLEAVDVATSWAAWDTLRRDQGLTVDEAKSVMTHIVTRLLEG